jgi:carbon monoxide dehydrogenase subunit G
VKEEKMVSINSKIDVNAPVDRIWGIISNVDRDPEYWKGLSTVENTRKEENLVERQVKVGFMGHKGHQIVKLYPNDSVELSMTDGPMKGSRTMKLIPEGTRTRIEVSWNFEFHKVPVFARGFVKSQLEDVTKDALQRIAKAAEAPSEPKNVTVTPSS